MRVVASLLAFHLGACSFAFVETAPRPLPPANQPVTCDVDPVSPGLDLAAFGFGFLGTFLTLIGLAEEPLGNRSDRLTRNEAIGITVATATLATLGVSGVWGLHQSQRCRRAKGLPPKGDEEEENDD